MKQPILGYAIPQLPSANLDKTADFFVKHLGFELAHRYPTLVIVKRAEAEIHFWLAPSEEVARSLGQESSCYIRVENIEPLFNEFKNREAPFRYELTKQPWSMNEMQIDDPYGNAIRFGEII